MSQMNDLISRQAALDALRSCQTYLFDAKDPDKKIELRSAELVIEGLPPVQPERKKGHWLRYGEDGYPNNEDAVFWQCDQCLEQYTGRTKRIPNFCPNCGADMRGGDSE